MMKALVREQSQAEGRVAALGVVAGRDWWSSPYQMELVRDQWPFMYARDPFRSATLAYLSYIVINPARRWYCVIRKAAPEAEIIFHFHSAWMTGGFLPLPTDPRLGVVATFHGVQDVGRMRATWWLRMAHGCLARRLRDSAAVLTSVDQDSAGVAEELFRIPRSAFQIVRNGLRVSDAPPTPLPLPPRDGFRVGHVGQMHHGKGWRLLLEAVDRMRKRGDRLQLILAGAGEDAGLARAAARKRDYVHFLGQVPNAAEALIPQLDALVLASWCEGMPMSIIEAFAAGVPVLATRVGGIPEMLEDGVNGLFIERSADSIIAGVGRLMAEPGLHGRLRDGARRTYQEKFTLATVVAEYERVYAFAMARRRASRIQEAAGLT
jgi:glycosyltransferase involved in cell wall biosynthesis